MKIYQLIYVDHEGDDTLGLFSTREKAVEAFKQNGASSKTVYDYPRHSEQFKIIEWDIDKWEGNTHESWDDEAEIKEK
jgi:hypothetical protein